MNLFNDRSSSDSTSRFWPQLAGLIGVAVVYWVAVRLGLMLVARPD